VQHGMLFEKGMNGLPMPIRKKQQVHLLMAGDMIIGKK
jgi:hypothetical protein